MIPLNGAPILQPEIWSLLVFGQRPFLLNEERKLHPRARAKRVKWWRDAFALEAMASDIPRPIPHPIRVIAVPILQHRYKQDVGACYPTAKAAIDGLVDAGFLPDDGNEWVHELRFLAPIIGQEVSGLAIGITTAQ